MRRLAASLGPLIILGHHYQRDDVIKHADLTGDSYQLSVMASQTDADSLSLRRTFHGRSADILGKPAQRVILPDLGAGCSMAEWRRSIVEDAWEQLREIGVWNTKSCAYYVHEFGAAIKAFCGRNEEWFAPLECRSLFDIYLKQFEDVLFPISILGETREPSSATAR